jgi:hypothetical protein
MCQNGHREQEIEESADSLIIWYDHSPVNLFPVTPEIASSAFVLFQSFFSPRDFRVIFLFILA